MKRFLLLSILTTSLFLSFLITKSQTYAAHGITITIAPSSNLKPFQGFSINGTGCSPNTNITVNLYEDGAFTPFDTKAIESRSDGSFLVQYNNGLREVRSYTVKVTCDGKSDEFVSKIVVEEFTGSITLQVGEVVVGEAILTVGGCPASGQVLLDVEELDSAGQIKTLYQLEDTADSSGESTFLFKKGTFRVDAACGGKNTVKYEFTVTDDGIVDENLFPAQPSPPEPPCTTKADGKCMSIITPIGEIRTDGVGIIYSILTVILSLSGGILVLTIMYSGYLLMMSRGNPEQIQKARDQIVSAIVGFLFIIFSFVILTVIAKDILRLPGFS